MTSTSCCCCLFVLLFSVVIVYLYFYCYLNICSSPWTGKLITSIMANLEKTCFSFSLLMRGLVARTEYNPAWPWWMSFSTSWGLFSCVRGVRSRNHWYSGGEGTHSTVHRSTMLSPSRTWAPLGCSVKIGISVREKKVFKQQQQQQQQD